jgi:hypothetical protein
MSICESPPGRSQAPQTADGAQRAASGGDSAGLPGQPETRPVLGWVISLARRHGLFGAVLLAGAAVRVITMLGFRGPMWTPDSTRYLRDAAQLAPGTVRPLGYSVVLRLLEPFHSLAAVVGVQHLMGLAIGMVGYALLRRAGLPGWGATIAMIPVLLSAYAVQLEHFVLSDTLFAVLVMIAVALMMWWPVPPVWACALTGLLLAAAALTRSEGTPLLIAFLVFLVARFAGWRTFASATAMCAAFAIPVTGYAAWYDSVNGTFELTSSTGAFLYGGVVATFADCAKMRPPAAERRLCVNVPTSQRKPPNEYIWRGPIDAVPGGPFGQRADTLGRSFALRAIRAQPLDYLRAAADSFWEDFQPSPNIHATSVTQRTWAQHQNEYVFPAASPKWPPQTTRIFSRYDLGDPRLRVIQPYAGWVRAYQRYVIVPGPLLGVIVLAGLGGLIVAWRRFGGLALLPWLVGLCLLVVPAAILASYPRYLVSDIPPLCVAAAIGIEQIADAAKRFRAARRAPA